jgi:hypothetical protein
MFPKRLVLCLVWVLSLSAFLPSAIFAEDLSLRFTPVSTAGSGGIHNAEEDGVFTLLSNPALLNSVTASMSFSLSGGAKNIYREGVKFAPPPAYYTLSGPIALGVVSKGVGFGIFNYFDIHYGRIDADVIGAVGLDWMLINATSFKLDFGLAAKMLFRYRLLNRNFASLFAPSVTPGILLSFGQRFQAGISYADALSVMLLASGTGAGNIHVSRSLDAGIAARLVSTGTFGLTIFTDYRDLIGDSAESSADPLQHLGAGIRAEFWNNYWFSAGMSGLVPTAGFGLNLGLVKLDFALSDYGAEAGIRITRE